MIAGAFDRLGRPRISGWVIIQRLQITHPVTFILDTGADVTSIGISDTRAARIPLQLLQETREMHGIGGTLRYFVEPSRLVFYDYPLWRYYDIDLLIDGTLGSGISDSLLGRDIIDNWFVQYDPRLARLECAVRQADYNVMVSNL